MTYDEIVNTLREGVVKLSFTKVKDGGVRDMTATLKSDLIPEDKMPKTDANEKLQKKRNAHDQDAMFELERGPLDTRFSVRGGMALAGD